MQIEILLLNARFLKMENLNEKIFMNYKGQNPLRISH